MSLANELGFREDFQKLPHECLLNLYYTASLIKKRSAEFFGRHGLTDVQFNVIMLLQHQGKADSGLCQVELGRMMLVNRANVTSLVDRMEKAGLVKRVSVPQDRRSNAVMLTDRGRDILRKVEEEYQEEVSRIMGALEVTELGTLIGLLERIRTNVNSLRFKEEKVRA